MFKLQREKVVLTAMHHSALYTQTAKRLKKKKNLCHPVPVCDSAVPLGAAAEWHGQVNCKAQRYRGSCTKVLQSSCSSS